MLEFRGIYTVISGVLCLKQTNRSYKMKGVHSISGAEVLYLAFAIDSYDKYYTNDTTNY